MDSQRPIRPSRWIDYVFREDLQRKEAGTLWHEFPPIIPFAIIDHRIIDLAMSFWQDPDGKLMTGYRRLEDAIRKRAKIDEHGAKLFSQAFTGSTAKLSWKGLDAGEQIGRAMLFTATFTAYRNPRAHKETGGNKNEQLKEFLLLNHLYCLESVAIEYKESKKRSKNMSQ